MHVVAPEHLTPDWPVPSGVRSLLTTRRGGVSRAPYTSFNLGDHVGDEADFVRRNRALLLRDLPAEPVWLAQVHGTEVVDADEAAGTPVADAAVTRSRGVVCAVLVADCMPVLLTDRAGSVVGVAHAGWRGLAAGIIERAVERMTSEPSEMLAFLGPAIGPDRYEVGEEVREAFISADAALSAAFRPHRPGKWLADLYALARRRLACAGVESVWGGAYCTFSDPARFFSYRRDGVTGRMAALIWRD